MPPAVARFVASSGGVSPALLEAVTLEATAAAPPLPRGGGWPVVLFVVVGERPHRVTGECLARASATDRIGSPRRLAVWLRENQ
jgi:hypothetical protein